MAKNPQWLINDILVDPRSDILQVITHHQGGNPVLHAIPSRRELLAWILVGVLAVTAVAVLLRPGPVDAAPGSIPLSGRTVAYLATGTNFPDALGAAPAAAVGLGPILLVQQNAIPQPTLDELNRIQPKEIFIMGGTGVISDAVKAQVQALPWSHTTTRVSGNDRYGTAAALSALTFPTTGFYPRVSHVSSNDRTGTGATRPC